MNFIENFIDKLITISLIFIVAGIAVAPTVLIFIYVDSITDAFLPRLLALVVPIIISMSIIAALADR